MTGGLWSLGGRLQLLWDSPIIAGTALAMLAPWLNSVSRWEGGLGKKSLTVVSVVVELFLLWCLVLTQSRGPVFGWMLATAGGILYMMQSRIPLRQSILIRSVTTSAFVVLALSLTALRGRIVEGVLLQDQSVSNRLDIWSASLKMLWLSPWRGIGSGEAGWTYSQWFQPDTSQYLYTGVLNGFLEIGIEQGVVILWLLVFGIATVTLLPWFCRRFEFRSEIGVTRTMLGWCSWVSLMAYFTANLTSSLHKSPTLMALALIDLVAFVVVACLIRDRRAMLRAASGAALLSTVILFFLRSVSLYDSREITVTCDHGAVVLAKTKSSAGASAVAVLVDRSVLGALFGRELRQSLKDSKIYNSMIVFDPRHALPQNQIEADRRVIITGRCARFLSLFNPDHPHDFLLINPEGMPTRFPESWTVQVWLPGGNDLGRNAQWFAIARPPKVTVKIRGKGGQLLAGGLFE